jgi:hypothetical protein
MDIIPNLSRGDNGFRSTSSLLVSETQLNISTPRRDAVTKYLTAQLRESEKLKSRKESKRLFEIKLREFGFDKEADLLKRCCENYKVLVCDNGHSFQPVPDFRCGLPFCPDCWIAKSERELRRNLPKLLQALKGNPKLMVMSATLTEKSDAERDLKAGCKKVKVDLKTLRRRDIFDNCVGGFGRIENTKTDKGWHPHLHATLLLKKPIPQDQLSKEWLDVTGDSKVVDIRKVSDLTESLLRTLTYPFKPADMKKLGKQEIEEMLAMKGERLGVSFGVLFGLETDAGITEQSQDAYGEFIAETKRLRVGDPCPICDSKLDLVDFSADGYADYLRSVPIPRVGSRGHPKCRDN